MSDELMSDSRKTENVASEDESRDFFATKTFWEHLEDLRWVLIKSAAALGISMVLCFLFARNILRVITWPLDRVTDGNSAQFLRTLEVTGGFLLSMKIAFFAGLILACPFILWFLGDFLLPALTRRERKLLTPTFTGGVLLFLAGCALGYFAVIPAGLQFFIQYNDYLGIRSEWTINSYVSFVTQMLLAFGVCFELPLVVLILAKLGLVTSRFLRDKRRIFIVLIFFVAAVITPTTDVFSLCLLAVPMVLLYEACVWIAWAMEKRNAK